MAKKLTKAVIEKQAYQLNQLAAQGKLPALKKLIAAGADLNARDSDSGFSPLISAAARGRLDIVKFLLSKGVHPDVRSEHKSPVDFVGATALMLAAYHGQLKMANLLLAAGADVNAEKSKGRGVSTALECAAYKGNLEMTRLLLRAGANLTPSALNRAAMSGKLPLLKELVKNKARQEIPFSASIIPIFLSLECPKKRQMEMVKFLLAAGADINGESATGDTSLRGAIARPDAKLLRWLLERGAKPNRMPKNGSTALHYAAFHGNCECIRVLLGADADPNLKDSDGRTPLQVATFHGQKKAVKLLKTVTR